MTNEDHHFLLNIALKAQSLLDKLDVITTEEFSRGGEREEREALRLALRPENPPTHEK